MSSNTATLTDNRTGKSYEFPILKGTMGPDVIDISTSFNCNVSLGDNLYRRLKRRANV